MAQSVDAWAELEPKFRQEWETHYTPTLGQEWEEIRDAFRFGWDMARRPEFRGKEWPEVAQDLARHWFRPEEASEEASWDQVVDAVREGWRHARQMVFD